MAAKSMKWMFVGVFCTLILMHVVLSVGLLTLQDGGFAVNARGADAAARFLNQNELEVKWIAGNATLNDGDGGSLASCRADSSRAIWRPLSGESRRCVSVHDSELYSTCPSEDVGCQNKILVDSNKSFVTLSTPSTTSLQMEVAQNIHLASLNSTSKTVSVPLIEFKRLNFSSNLGALRSSSWLHGSDSQCTSYPLRCRHLCLNGISVPRDVKILVDVAKSMNQLLSADYKRPPGATYLDVAKNMTLTLLQTFTPGDNVEVFPFDATDAASLGGALAVIGPYNHFNIDPELAALVTNVNALVASSDAGASDLNGAIRRAAGSFNQIQSLKVIIVISNGLFVVNGTSFPSAALQSNGAKLMVYKLPTNDDGGGTFLQSTPFQKEICSVQGTSFELLDALATSNPLNSMRSYFTYLAGIQVSAASGNVTWTATYARGIILMTCYSQTNVGPANWSCPPLDSGICPQNDTTRTIQDRACCESCAIKVSQEATQKQKWFITGSALIATLLTIIIIVGLCYWRKISLKYLSRQPQRPGEEDLFELNLCERVVNIIEKQKSMRNLLNERQCLDLSSKLSTTTRNIREIISCCGASANLFKPALEKLYLDLEKAKVLVLQCGKADWCRAAVFQIHNEIAFQEILLDIGLCYNAIYEQANSLAHEEGNFPEDLRQSNVFMPARESDVRIDQVTLQKRLEVQAHGLKVSGRVSAKQCLARYLLEKLKHPSYANALDTCNTILWTKENSPPGIWGNSYFLGAGSGSQGVCSTKWLGVPCAKKVFHVNDSENFFLKEASISAHLKHPCVVNFICCGNGVLKGDRFIAMELMEKNLSDLIEAQGEEHFSLPVVMDIMVQIARGMCYLHGQGIAHRDLKPHNVVINTHKSPHLEDRFFTVKLVDFGMSKTKVEVLRSNLISMQGVGTTIYRAPEIHPNAHPDGVEGKARWFKADAFSFAMTCAHVLSLQRPFKDTMFSDIYANLVAGKRHELPGDCPEELTSLLEDCWTTDPSLRPSFVEIWTRLEALRFKILRGYPTSYESRPQGKSDEFITVTIDAYNKAGIQKPRLDASNGVPVGNEATNALEIKVEDIMTLPSPSIREAIASHASIEMTESSQILRRLSS